MEPTHKEVAKTLTSVLDTEEMQVIQNLDAAIDDLTNETIKNWSPDLFTRKPGSAMNSHGEFVGSDLDLATFLTALAIRRAVIVLPTYKRLREGSVREGERHTSGIRNGNLNGLYSNDESFTFGVNINDFSVVTQDPVTGKETAGAPRKFAIMGVDGKWHDGWKRIEFSPTAKENDFLSDHKVWTDNTFVVKQFTHVNRWVSFYGYPYFQAKALRERIREEAKHLNQEIKRLLAAGISYPPGQFAPVDWPETKSLGDKKTIKIKAMQVEIDLPEPTGKFPALPNTQEALVNATIRRKKMVYTSGPMLSFATRAVELSFFLNGFAEKDQTGGEKFPGWIKNAKWERDHKPTTRSRNLWNRLVLFQPAVGQKGVALRYRIYEKSEQVADHGEEE